MTPAGYEPAATLPDDGGAGREVHDGAEAASAVLQGEPLVLLRSESLDAQAGNVDALRAALRDRPIRMLRLDGKRPRRLSRLAAAEHEADRAVLVVEHADTLEATTLNALRDVENLQLVLFHRGDAIIRTDEDTLGSASVRFPPGHLMAFDLDPKRKPWRIVMATTLAVAIGGLLLGGILYFNGPERSQSSETVATTTVSPPPEAVSPAPTQPPTETANGQQAATSVGSEAAPSPDTAAPSAQPSAAVPGPAIIGNETPAETPVASSDQTSPTPSEPTAAPASAEPAAAVDAAPAPSPPTEVTPAPSPAAPRVARHGGERALKRDFDRFLLSDHHLPRHLSHAQRSALFSKFLAWRARQEAAEER